MLKQAVCVIAFFSAIKAIVFSFGKPLDSTSARISVYSSRRRDKKHSNHLITQQPHIPTGGFLKSRKDKENMDWFKWIADQLGTLRTIITGTTVFALSIILSVSLYLEISKRSVIIESFDLPPSLIEKGYSSRVTANKLADAIGRVIEHAKTNTESPHFAPDFYDNLPDVEVPEIGVSFGSIIQYLKGLFDYDSPRVNGEFVVRDDRIFFTVRIVGNRQEVIKAGSITIEGKTEEIDSLLQRAAQFVLRQSHPYILACFFFEKGQMEQSLELVQHCATQKDNKLVARAYNLWGRILHARGEYEAAIVKYQDALKHDPQNANAHNNWGLTLQKMGHYEDAITQYQHAIKIEPKFALAYNNWGYALMSYENYNVDEVIGKFERAISLDPTNHLAYENWANLEMKRNNPSAADSKYEAAAAHNPTSAEIYDHWGTMWLEGGNYDQAISKYEKAIKINHEYAPAFNNLGYVMEKLGETEQAIKNYRESIKLNPKEPKVFINLGKLLVEKEDYKIAEGVYRDADKFNPNNSSIYTSWGWLLEFQNKYREAINKYCNVIALQHNQADIDYAIKRIKEIQDNLPIARQYKCENKR